VAYRVKDLMIKILGSEGQGPDCGALTAHACPTPTAACQAASPLGTFCPTATLFCEGGSWTTHIWTCPTPTTFCPTATLFCPGISGTTTPWFACRGATEHCFRQSITAPSGPQCHIGPDPTVAAEQLAMLKAHLKEALEEIERQEEVANEQAQPQTRAEIEELEAKMKEALAELSKRKSELKKE
jgi:hypothetical protein